MNLQKKSKIRIFIAIPIPKPLRAAIKSFKLPDDIPFLRRILQRNLHITLIPPWYEDDVEKVKSALDKLRGTIKPFGIKFHKVAFGPTLSRPRLIWAEGPVPGKIKILIEKLKNILGKDIVLKTSENRPFLMHMTLARLRKKPVKIPTKKTFEKTVSWKFSCDSIVLMQSHLNHNGAEYKILHKVKL